MNKLIVLLIVIIVIIVFILLGSVKVIELAGDKYEYESNYEYIEIDDMTCLKITQFNDGSGHLGLSCNWSEWTRKKIILNP